MKFIVYDFEPNDSPLEDHEYPDTYGQDDSWDETPTAPCPNCGAEIDADSIRCPVCESYVTFSTNIWTGKSVWWIVLGLLGVAAVCVALALG